MSTTAEIRSPIERRKVGMEALTAALGSDDAAAFLRDLFFAATDDDGYLGIPGWNYTEWRKGQPEPTPEEVESGILRIQAERKARDTLKS